MLLLYISCVITPCKTTPLRWQLPCNFSPLAGHDRLCRGATKASGEAVTANGAGLCGNGALRGRHCRDDAAHDPIPLPSPLEPDHRTSGTLQTDWL